MSGPIERKRGRILPRDAGAAPLDVVIGIMAFLAVLSLGSVLIAERMSASWESGLIGRLTVQILPVNGVSPEPEVAAALTLLRATPGVVSATPLTDAENLALVQPWLGSDAVVADLPFPRLIDVRLQPGAGLDTAALTTRLKAAAPHGVLDDHGRWIGRLRDLASTVVYSAVAVLLLIAIAMAATVAFATRAGLAAHHEIVELLHLMGAQDRFIARAFEWHYFVGAAVAAAGGAFLGAVIFLAAGGLDEIGFNAVSFLPPMGLKLAELPWLIMVPLVAALIAWGTARLSVLAVLAEYN